jgi:glutathione S-transferase
MDLYFSPFSCSLATRVTLYELGLPANFQQVNLYNKTLAADGTDYLKVNPKGQVPALRTDDGLILTEAAAVLQYVADLDSAHRLAPAPGTVKRSILQQWLNYVATEIHKGVFATLFNPVSPPEAKAFARGTVLPLRYTYLSQYLKGRDYLLDDFSVADAYLATTLNWASMVGVDLSAWPVLQGYLANIMQRPAFARAVQEEAALRQPH